MVFIFHRPSFVKNHLGNSLTYRQDYTFVLVEIIDFHCPTVNVAGVTPASIHTCRYPVSAPRATGLESASTRGFYTYKFVRMAKNSFTGAQHNDLVVGGYAFEQLTAVSLSPFPVYLCTVGPIKVAFHVFFIER